MHSRSVLFAVALVGAGCATQAPSSSARPATLPTAVAPAEPTPPAPVATPVLASQAAPAQRGVQVGDLDRAADPCTDFFQYANGAWRRQNPIPASMSRWSRRWAAGEANKDQLKNLLEEVAARSDWKEGSPEQLAGDLYAGCVDEKAVEARGLTPVQPLLAQIEGIKGQAELMKAIVELQSLGIFAPFSLFGESDPHEPGQVIAHLGSGGLGMPDRDYYSKQEPRFVEARAKYQEHVARMFQLAGRDEKKAKQAAQAVFELESKLAAATLDNVEQRDPTKQDNRTTFPLLQKRAPHFDWVSYFTTAGIPQIDLNVQEPRFVAEFDHQLTATGLEAWKSYLAWQVLHALSDQLPAAFVQESFAFNEQYLQGAREMKPRWKKCAELTDQLLGEALGQKYVERYFPPAAKARVEGMVKNLLGAMRETVEGLAWMTPETKKRALEKISTFNPKIGYPNKWKTYAGVVVKRAAFSESANSARRFLIADNHSTIGKAIDRDRWNMTPPTSNAYYNPLLNEIVFPAGILQPPAFDLGATDAVNYGSIGVVIGHEVSHGFDDQGAQFDAQGRLHNWWTESDLTEFQKRGQCVVDQFESYFIEPGIHHNGKLVLGESIGDLAGAKIAWRAFQKANQEHPGKAIDGFTPEQQFFIAWGQFRGDETRPETQRMMVQGDPHPVAKFRVLGPLGNLPDFAKTFSCKADAAMVRPAEKRCEVW